MSFFVGGGIFPIYPKGAIINSVDNEISPLAERCKCSLVGVCRTQRGTVPGTRC